MTTKQDDPAARAAESIAEVNFPHLSDEDRAKIAKIVRGITSAYVPLRAENARLREALERILGRITNGGPQNAYPTLKPDTGWHHLRIDEARAALAEGGAR